MNANTNAMEKIGTGAIGVQVGQESKDVAGELLAHLAPLFPVVASATKSDMGAAAWIRSWSLQIELSGLRPLQIERGLGRLHRHDPDVPFSWPAFHLLCVDPFLDANDSSLLANDQVHQANRARQMLEYRAKYPSARFAGDAVKHPGAGVAEDMAKDGGVDMTPPA